MPDSLKGLLAMVGASTIWGLSGLFYALLSHVPAVEVLAHRTVWSFVFFAFVIAATGRGPRLAALLRDRASLRRLVVTAMMISVNWFVFIWSIQSGRAIDASLGYYIFPLVAVLIGVIWLRERPAPLHWAAIALAAAAVAFLTWYLGVVPWIPLLLAGTFGVYGLMKKRLAAGPVLTVLVEVLFILPFAVAFLAFVHAGVAPGEAAFGRDGPESLLLILSGPLTGLPLLLFSYAAQRMRYSALGLVQYLNPTLQFGVAVLALGEAVTRGHAIALPFIWTALALYSLQSFRQERAARRRARISSGVV
ncbi:MAG: EamA family transporter RarD [Rubricella sp.]